MNFATYFYDNCIDEYFVLAYCVGSSSLFYGNYVIVCSYIDVRTRPKNDGRVTIEIITANPVSYLVPE